MLTGASEVEYVEEMIFFSGFDTSMSEARFIGTESK